MTSFPTRLKRSRYLVLLPSLRHGRLPATLYGFQLDSFVLGLSVRILRSRFSPLLCPTRPSPTRLLCTYSHPLVVPPQSIAPSHYALKSHRTECGFSPNRHFYVDLSCECSDSALLLRLTHLASTYIANPITKNLPSTSPTMRVCTLSAISLPTSLSILSRISRPSPVCACLAHTG